MTSSDSRSREMEVPFLDLGGMHAEVASEITQAIERVMQSSQFVLGEEVESFEQEFADYTGAAQCVGVASGLDALFLTLRAMGVGPGDEVIVPSHTFIATWLAVSHCGARPVPVEPVDDLYVMDPERVEAAVTKRTKVILPVHLYGMPADMDAIVGIARRHGVMVLEDAAQCHGAHYRDRRIGAHGDAVAWSFYPTKNLGALGDGGAVTCNSELLAERLRELRNYGSPVKYVNRIRGFNSRLDSMQAAVLRVKLKRLDGWNEHRKILAARYQQALRHTGLQLPMVPHGADHVWHLYVVRTRQRERLMDWLSEHGVQAQVHYPIPPHLQDAYADHGYQYGDFPIAERLAGEVLSLPMWPYLDHAVQDHVVAVLQAFGQ